MEVVLSGFDALSFFLLTFASVFFFLGYGSSEWAEYRNEENNVLDITQVGVWDACTCSHISDIKSRLPDFAENLSINM